jgi:hypothetical protein
VWKQGVKLLRGWWREQNLEEGKLRKGAGKLAANPRPFDNGLSYRRKP